MEAPTKHEDAAPGRWLTTDRGYLLCLLALVVLVTRPALAGSTFLGGDVATHNLPMLQLAAQCWQTGQFPGWNPWLGLGQPFVSDLSLVPYYPGYAILLVASPGVGLDIFVVVHLLSWAAAVYYLARTLGTTGAGSFVAAATMTLGGAGLSHLGISQFLAGISWTTWGIVGFLRQVNRPWRPEAVFTLALPFALAFLCSSVEYLVMAGLSAFVLGQLVARNPTRLLVLRLAATALAAVVLVGCALVPLLASLAEVQRGAGFPFATATIWSAHPLEALGLLVPQAIWGEPGALPGAWAGLPVGRRPWYPSLYMGAVPLVLAALALKCWRHDRRVRWVAWLGLAFALYAAGRFSPAYLLAWELLPPVRSLRYPAKFLMPTLLALSLLAGFGLDRWRSRGATAASLRPWLVACAVVVMLVAAIGAALDTSVPASRAWYPLLAILLASLPWRLAPRSHETPAAGGATRAGRGARVRCLLLVVGLDLVLGARFSIWTAPRQLLAEQPDLVGAVRAEEHVRGAPQRVAVLPGLERLRVSFAWIELDMAAAQLFAERESLQPNTGMPYGLRSTRAFSSFKPRRQVLLSMREVDLPPVRAAKLRGARLAVCSQDQLSDGLERVAASGPWQLARLPDPPPWAAVYGRSTVVADADAALEVVLDPLFRPGSSSVIEAPSAQVTAGPAGVIGPARCVSLAADRIELELSSPAAGMLIVREGWGRGWSALVDGEVAPVYPADLLFRAVPVPAGEHTVVLSYQAPGRSHGNALTLLGLTLMGLSLLRLGSRRARDPSA